MENAEKVPVKGVTVRMLRMDGAPPRPTEKQTSYEEFNLAMEWLNYARSSAQLLADRLHEMEEDGDEEFPDLALAANGICAMIREGTDRAASCYSTLRFEHAERNGMQIPEELRF
ncbi:hypothetical protein L2Y96_18825 [Luteibacter aegosomaticola]|uniref:hypothetical protein n=1 Tax=Luteibacter aegosomaticola TaxID=2911538 RepID=UPI001FFB4466|nr:hypothetical protein [Luteibacter aegosomaticola]UPG89425.1 hypothetical protein L2Y96_18825 [Luteibacter aegosomaticola]